MQKHLTPAHILSYWQNHLFCLRCGFSVFINNKHILIGILKNNVFLLQLLGNTIIKRPVGRRKCGSCDHT